MRVQLAAGFAAIIIAASLVSGIVGMTLTSAQTVTSMVTSTTTSTSVQTATTTATSVETSTTTSISIETSTSTTYDESEPFSIQLELQNQSTGITISVYLANLTGPTYDFEGTIVNQNPFNVTLVQDNLCFVNPDGTKNGCGGMSSNTQPIPPGGSYPISLSSEECVGVTPSVEPCTAGFISQGLLSVNYTASLQTPYGRVEIGPINIHVGSPAQG